MSTASGPSSGGGDVNVLLKAIAEQAERLRAAQKTHGECAYDSLPPSAVVSPSPSSLSAAPASPRARVGRPQAVGAALRHERRARQGAPAAAPAARHPREVRPRLHGVPDIADQHLLRALGLREQCHGKNSLKVAETLNSLALVSQMQGEMEQAKTYQLRSLQVLYDSAEPEDIESEDIPWEVYKRLKQQRGPSTAANSITLLKGNMRKSVMDVVYKTSGALSPTEESARLDTSEGSGAKGKALGAKADTLTTAQKSVDVDRKRVLRSRSETTINSAHALPHGGSASDRFPSFHTSNAVSIIEDPDDADSDPLAQSRINVTSSSSLQPLRSRHDTLLSSGEAPHGTDAETPSRLSAAVPIAQSIRDFPTLQQRVESLKRRILAGYPDVNADVARLTADVDRIQARELREVGWTMVALVREMNRLCVRTDLTQQQLPVLEGMLEKKSASIFRGWEKRWFKVDPKTFILSYHFSKDDYARGFTPRGGVAHLRAAMRGRGIAALLGGDPALLQGHDGPEDPSTPVDKLAALSTMHGPEASRLFRCAEGVPVSDSIVLEEEIDPNYEPTEKEVLEYATWLGMDLEAERDLFWIAREGLKASDLLGHAPLPENWKPCKTTDTEEIYYFNFATGQSTWDHPCDEFYRNLYEEHKKKRQTNDVQVNYPWSEMRLAIMNAKRLSCAMQTCPTAILQETDEKKKKVKEDVAELLGRKGSGKKKKGSLSKAEPLGGPSMGKVNPLEKKPLPGLSGRLGSLGSSGLGGAGLKPVAGLGPLKSDAKEHGGSGIGLDCATNDFKSDDLSKPLSRTPLGTVLGKKPLLSSPSVTTGDRDTAANFEDKRDQLSQDHAEKLREIQDAHDSEVETLRKKLKAQLEDVQDAEEMKLKQLRREFDKKKNDLENQFDREENTLQRSRKEQLKRLETETENIFTCELKHDEKQRKIQEEFEREDEKLTEKMKSLFGDKKEAVQLATELKSEVDRLQSHQKSLEQEVSTIRSEKETLAREMGVVEQERDNAQRDAEELRRQLSEVSHSQSTAAHEECTECSVLENSLAALKAECAAAKTEAGGMREELDRLKIESEAGATAEQEKNDAAIAFSNQEAVLKQEITTLQRQLAVLDAESSDLRTRCTALQSKIDTASPSESSHMAKNGQLEALQRQLSDAQAELADTKTELSELQDQHTVILTTNAQVKEQLMKESNERKALSEQLDSEVEEAAQHLAREVEKYQQQLQILQQKLETESQARQEQEAACDTLRKDILALEEAKRKVDAELCRLKSDRLNIESESLGVKEETVRLIEHEKEVDRLRDRQSELEKELIAIRSDRDRLLHEKNAAETERNKSQREVEELRCHLLGVNQHDTPPATSQECVQCCVSQERISSLQSECAEAHTEKEKLQKELTTIKQEFEARVTAERENTNVAVAMLQGEKDDQESLFKGEVLLLQEKLTTVEAESRDLRAKYESLRSEKDTADRRESDISTAAFVAQEQLKTLECQFAAAQAEVTSAKSEVYDLQNQHATLLSANTQLQEHLAKEVNEKKALREQLDAKAEEISERLAGASDKHQQQVLSLQQQLENESRVRREREDACDSLRKEINALEQAKRKVDAELGQLESDKRHLESEKSMLALRLDEINTSRKREEKSVVSAEEALADKKLEAEQLRANLKVVESDREHLEARIKTLHQDFEQLLAKTHRLEAENEGERVRCRTIEKERDSASQRQQSLVDELENSQRKSRTLTAELSELQSQLSKARANEQAVTSKADQITHKMRQLEQQKERDDFAMKMKFQQAEVEHESILHAKDRAEMQLQAKEKELAAAKDEVTRKETEIESLQARIKSLLSDKEEVQAALLNANMANVASASANRESAKSISASNDVMLVKLQLADTNRNELELHLADISSQLEISTRRCASLEARCRDQSIEIESLHVEVASLRSASQKMHVSALESLALVERLEYEHKKRTLRSDFLNQLRDFQEREEQALVRHKARLRAQYERHLEDLVAELEKVRQQRVEQEEALSAQMVQQIRQERDVKRSDAKRRVREELTQFEQDLHERKARDIEIISRAIEKEENELGARLREVRQVSREKELAKDLESPGNKGKTDISHDRSAFASPGQLLKKISVRRNQPESLDDDDAEDYVTGKRSRTSDPMYDSKRSSRHQVKSMKTYQKWRQRLQEEMDLLVNARTLVANQRQGLTKQAHQLKASKKEWKRNSRLSEENPIQREVKRMLDENMANWSEGMRKLRKQESWVKQREQKLAKMKRTVERLKRRRRAERSNNLSGSETGSDCDDDDETRTDWSDDSGQSELASTLEKLERLEEELASDAGSFSGALPLGVSDRFRSSGFDAVYHVPPPSYALQREAPYRYPLASPSGFFASRRAAYAAGDLAGQDMRWLRSQRTAFGLRGDRFAVAPAPGSGSRAEQVYQQKISRWAKGREKVQHAATTHATWLSGLCEELKEYGAKYTRVEGDYAGSDGGGQLTQEEGD
ncbi:hypothetical protein ON010_g8385 [Phytophthora cinnamomi]|nr:hypothetical protein ON010_g8385 [Phytophthora cinnamomi]